ncbi:acyltransferase [Natronorubrum halophilum]|uniref:acyltransferase n=1 Tax=Natronorubrum halophilum TaxID=1702106 RepID=UPI000EF75482|nr:acyltransferase [Natronorubrum halophilum]
MTSYDIHRDRVISHLPWREIPESMEAVQTEWQTFLRDEYDLSIGDNVFISEEAVVDLPNGRIGDGTIIASGAIVRGDVTIGANCSVNPYVNIAGKVTVGDGVRIASTASLWGENHVFADPDTPIHQQGNRYEGIEVGDDVWIGAGAVVLDGTAMGSHSVIGAGAVVTSDVPEYAIVVGNPGTIVGYRGESNGPDSDSDLRDRLSQFGEMVAEQVSNVISTHQRSAPDGNLPDHPDSTPVRALCDAVEIAGMFDETPPGWNRTELIEELQDLQDPDTGLLPNSGENPSKDHDPTTLPPEWRPYHILSVGYALEVLGETFEHRIFAVDNLSPEDLYEHLEELPWETNAWGCGAWIDHYATGLYFNHRYFASDRSPASVFGWLETSIDPDTGLWGKPTADEGWLQPVNGFYRATRGTYAQYGLEVPFPEATIDTVLRHGRDSTHFREGPRNACNTLDVVHPLWLCGQQTDYRRDEIEKWARIQLDQVLDHWRNGQGFAFELTDEPATLQGTEMWLSVVYLLAELCGMSGELGYKPRGVHRTDVGFDLYRQ